MDCVGSYNIVENGVTKATLDIEKVDDNRLRLSGKVGNRMNTELKIKEDGSLAPGPVMMTRMMPPPELQSLEKQMSSILENLTSITKKENVLTLTAGEDVLTMTSVSVE